MKKTTLRQIVLLIVFIDLSLQCSIVQAQTVVVGSGTAVNGETESSPVNIWYRSTVCHFVITKAELNAAGYSGPGNINKIGWFVTQSPAYNLPDYTIRMQLTTATDASGLSNGGWTDVNYMASYTPDAGKWNMFTINSPFFWDGVSNVGIRICWSQVQPTYNSSGQCRVFSASSGYEYRWTDNAGNSCAYNPNSFKNYKPQVQFLFDTLTTWTGVVSSDWFDAGNWTADVPDSRMDAVIPSGTPNAPVLIGTGECEEFILSGDFTVSAGSVLNVYSHFTNTGTYTDNGGTLVITGENASNFNTTAIILNELFITNKGGTTISGAMVTIAGELQVNKSTLNTGNLVTIRSDASSTGRINELKATCTYMLDMQDFWGDGWNGAFITVLEDGSPIGTYAASGTGSVETFDVSSGSTITINYTSGAWENENTYDLIDPNSATIFSDGPDPSIGNVFTTIAACNFTPPITGTISMERYIDAGATYWRYFSSAVQGATVEQYNDDFTTAGYPGSQWPTFPFTSVYTYDETLGPGLGYVPCSGATQIIEQGQGYQVYCGDTITGTQPFTVDLIGVPNQGDITMPVTFTNTGTASEDGWNLVGNPYPSTIDWESAAWTKTNMANAVYIQNPDTEQYATYVSGASTNGGSRYIASQQSFWVYAFAASPQLVASEGTKVDIDQAFFKSNEVLSPGLKIRLEGNQEFDEVVMRHVDQTNDDFEPLYDAKKMWGGWGLYPQLSLINGEASDLTVHSFDKNNQEWAIPMRAIVFQNGTYNIEFENVSELDIPCLKLEDLYSGQMFDIEDGTVLQFEMYDTTYSPRFILHLGRNYETITTTPTCFGNSDGALIIDLDDSQSFNYLVSNGGNSFSGSDSVDPLVIDNLVSGIYSIEVFGINNLCNQSVFNFVVNQPNMVGATATITEETFGMDGMIEVNVTGGTAPYEYLWSTGEMTATIDGLNPGNYNLSVTDDNGCTWEGDFYVGSVLGTEEGLETPINFIYFRDQNIIQLTGWSGKSEQLDLYNVNGQHIYSYTLKGDSGKQEFTLPADLSDGVYVIKGTNGLFFRFVY